MFRVEVGLPENLFYYTYFKLSLKSFLCDMPQRVTSFKLLTIQYLPWYLDVRVQAREIEANDRIQRHLRNIIDRTW